MNVLKRQEKKKIYKSINAKLAQLKLEKIKEIK